MVYSITAILLFFLSLIVYKNSKYEKPILIVTALWLIVHDGIRWEIGTDWEPYYDFFMYGDNDHMGLLYTWLNGIIKYVFNSYTVFLLVVSIFTYSVVAVFFFRYSQNGVMSLLIYYCTMMGSMGSNRQILAMLVCILSVRFIFERKHLWFWLTIAFAVLFHAVALSFIPAYYLYGKNINSKKIVAITVAAFFIGLLKIVNKIPFVDYLVLLDNMSSGTTMLSSYFDKFEDSVSLLGALKRVAFVVLAILMRKRINNLYYDYFLVLYSIGSIIFLVFNGSVLQLFAGKASACYSFYECILMPFIVYYFPKKNIRLVVWLCYFILIFTLMWRDMNSYRSTAGYDIYNPYKTVLL